MEDVNIPSEKRRDPFVGKPRDTARTPIQWDDSPNAGFTAEGIEPWLPISPDYKDCNVKKQLEDPQSMYSLYKQLLRLRKKFIPRRPILLDVRNDNILAYTRCTKEGKDAIVLLNFSQENESVDLGLMGTDSGMLLLNTSLDRQAGEYIDFSNLTLKPKEGYICLLQFAVMMRLQASR